RVPAGGADLVVHLLERACASCADDDVGALAGERDRKRTSEPARCAGDESDTILEAGRGCHTGLFWLLGDDSVTAGTPAKKVILRLLVSKRQAAEDYMQVRPCPRAVVLLIVPAYLDTSLRRCDVSY